MAAPEGDQVVPVINQLMSLFDLIISSRDWHPETSVHFQKWPVHCVRMSHGSDYHPSLMKSKIQLELLKGTRDSDDGYSAFEATNVNLGAFLRQKKVDTLFITGLITEHCIKNTVLDAIDYGFKTFVVTDAIGALHKEAGEPQKSLDEMTKAGANLITSLEVPEASCE
jgi:nicotinamidase/pyrazinamidase